MSGHGGVIEERMVGWPIYTAKGDDVGDVKEVRGRYFKVDVPQEADFWLRDDCVGSVEDGRIILTIERDGLRDYRVAAPPGTPESRAVESGER